MHPSIAQGLIRIRAKPLMKSYTGGDTASMSARTCVHGRPSAYVRFVPFVVVRVCVFFPSCGVSIVSDACVSGETPPTPLKDTVVFFDRLSANSSESLPDQDSENVPSVEPSSYNASMAVNR